MADKTITALTSYTPPIPTDVLPIVDVTTTTTKKITIANISAYLASLAQTLTNKTLVAPLLGTPTSGDLSNCTGSASSLKVGHLIGGAGGSIPYQSAANTTAFLANGSSGAYLQSQGGTNAPTWVASTLPAGLMFPYGGTSAPTGYLLCDGSAVSRTTYSALFTAIGTNYGAGNGSTTFNVPDLRGRSVIGTGTGTKVLTFASRSSDTVTVTGAANNSTNEVQTGQAVTYHSATTVMTGLTNDTVYYLIRISATSFKLASSLANAVAGTAISLSSDGSGAQTFTMTLTARTIGDTGGEETHALVTAELPSHSHDVQTSQSGTGGAYGYAQATATASSAATVQTGSTGGSTAHNEMGPYQVATWIIST